MNSISGKEQRYDRDPEWAILDQQLEAHAARFYEVAPDPECNIDPQAQQEFETRVLPVQCRICGKMAAESEKSLREKGWSLTWKHGERCPEHNYRR